MNMNFDSSNGDFKTEIKIDTSIDAPTEIHALINADDDYAWYSNGFHITYDLGETDPKV